MDQEMDSFEKAVEKRNKDVPILYQIPLLGLEEIVVQSLVGKRCLDIGCGIGALVNHLRSKGVNAEGLDPRAPKKDYFKRTLILGAGRKLGIPENDNTYDLITAFQNTALNSYFTSDEEFMEIFKNLAITQPDAWRGLAHQAMGILKEIGRTLKPQGKAIIYPCISTLEERSGVLLKYSGLSHYNEAVPRREALNYNEWEAGFMLEDEECIRESFTRTVLVKQR